jgi:diacylglycerol kinase (ATP)
MVVHNSQRDDYSPSDNPYKQHRGLTRIKRALHHSIDGLIYAFREECAFRQEILLATLMLPWVFIVDFNATEKLLLVGTVVIVLLTELMNSGIEAAIDRISFDEHSLSKRAKDYGSAAVLLALLFCGGTWLLLFFPHLKHLI